MKEPDVSGPVARGPGFDADDDFACDLAQDGDAAGAETVAVTVEPADAGSRTDRFLAGRLPDLSRTRLQRLVADGRVRNGERVVGDAAERVNAGDVLTVAVPAPEPAEPVPQDIPLNVVHEDAHLIVIDKPAGLVVHPAPGHWDGTLVNALLHHCGESLSGIGGVRRPGIVHRLDKDTSGLLVVAKTDAAHKHLAAQFADHGRTGDLTRAYLAFVWGAPGLRGTVDAPIDRHATNRQKMSVRASGREAITHWRLIETFPDSAGEVVASLVECHLETGRTHQIRVHMAHIGHPLLGDEVYGAGFRTKISRLPEAAQAMLKALDRQALHAAHLGFADPATGEVMGFDSELPADLAALETALRTE
ncbi:RluA family pseudouridine synthase [Aquabacter sp. P-9]|uniref:RluA family pseudouridine synthase n=1 Tax=Aquabacter sediminis TaxID=3029197 RepID=UPI00237E1468|nr:RluA family pseudouridine synthase [Aquabacter sp. P-9]MDE1571223.1 RluA family pseudouridine synthase [Aquabacter sp. P-9]